MNPLKQFYLVTSRLIKLLEEDKQSDRDVWIEEVNQLLSEREELLKEIAPPFTEGETALGKQIVPLNEKLNSLLEKEKLNIQKDLQLLQVRRKSEKKYVNPYASLQVDGVFYDKRK